MLKRSYAVRKRLGEIESSNDVLEADFWPGISSG
jgi:hypothetical protein